MQTPEQQSTGAAQASPVSEQQTRFALQMRGAQHCESLLQKPCETAQPLHVPSNAQTIPLQQSESSLQLAPTEPQHMTFMHGSQTWLLHVPAQQSAVEPQGSPST